VNRTIGSHRQTRQRQPVAVTPADTPIPAYDTSKYTLGALCPRGREYANTGQKLRRISSHTCRACDTEMQRERRQARRRGERGDGR
jgi:hypothetical protein